MRLAPLILTYTNPKQTERVIRNIAHPNFDLNIHLDNKYDINTHLFLKNLPNVFFINNSIDVKWAAFNSMIVSFEGIKNI